MVSGDLVFARKMRVTNSSGTIGRTTCTACGASVRQRDNFCWRCGAQFDGYATDGGGHGRVSEEGSREEDDI